MNPQMLQTPRRPSATSEFNTPLPPKSTEGDTKPIAKLKHPPLFHRSSAPPPRRLSPPPPLKLFGHQKEEEKNQGHSFMSQSNNPASQLNFFTPQTKLAKPLPSAFHSTGLISKKSRPRPPLSVQPTPETPAKKLHFSVPRMVAPTVAKKPRSPFQDSPIKMLKFQAQSTPLRVNKPLTAHNEGSPRKASGLLFKTSPQKLLDTDDDENVPEPMTSLFQKSSTSPVKSCKFTTPTSKSIFDINSSALLATPLRKTKQFNWLSSHQIYTPYPRFIDLPYLQKLRDPQGPAKETFSGNDIYPDYFDTHFHIVEKLGQGSFANAFKVMSKIDGTMYAIKKSKQPYSGHKDRMKKLEEVEMMFLVNGCSHCVQLLNAWEQCGYLYLQMELCEGGTLQAYVDNASPSNRMEEIQIWRIMAEIALGLKEIHDKDIIHLDLKPANIFVNGEKLKIGDFGLATFYPVAIGMDREGDRTYIAPEILESDYDKAADVFSLGLIILEICANIVLPEYGEYWHMLRRGDFSAISLGPISPPLIELVKAMMDPQPSRRPTIHDVLCHPFVSTLAATEDMVSFELRRKSGDLIMTQAYPLNGMQTPQATNRTVVMQHTMDVD